MQLRDSNPPAPIPREIAAGDLNVYLNGKCAKGDLTDSQKENTMPK
jgi:hypothetical protein